MNQSQFEQTYRTQWREFGTLLDVLEQKSPPSGDTAPSLEDFPRQYRRLCNHYGLAQTRHYSPALVDSLHDLVLRGHRQLYKKKPGLGWAIIHFLARDFPCNVRRHAAFFWLAFALFYLPAVGFGTASYFDSSLLYSVMSESQVASMESMYSPHSGAIGRLPKRSSDTDFTMFGYYILNNISIGFRTFAGGIAFGAGAVFLLLFNGLMIGGVAGHLSHPPYRQIFWQFALGHGAFELTAIVICGAAGLLLGYSLLRPGGYRRLDSLRIRAPAALNLVMGAAAMLVCAAFIEAFWSSSTLSPVIKFGVAGLNWALVAIYLLGAGRNTSARAKKPADDTTA